METVFMLLSGLYEWLGASPRPLTIYNRSGFSLVMFNETKVLALRKLHED